MSALFSYTTHFNPSPLTLAVKTPTAVRNIINFLPLLTPTKRGISRYSALPQLSSDSTCPNCSFLEKHSQKKKKFQNTSKHTSIQQQPQQAFFGYSDLTQEKSYASQTIKKNHGRSRTLQNKVYLTDFRAGGWEEEDCQAK